MLPALAKQISNDIDVLCQDIYDDGHRKHLGASVIGHECSRFLWYSFRWVKHEKFSGRMYRLFNRGHLEENRFLDWLDKIGCKTQALTKEGHQLRINDVKGHFGGSIDGFALLPERYNVQQPVLLEFKTSSTGQAFEKLKRDKMALAKPQHWAQVCTYGYKLGLEHVLYMAVNKNDDDLHVELTKLDHSHGEAMIGKAHRIIMAESAPAKLSENSTFFKCGYCAMNEICHKGAVGEVNCRSCSFAEPVEDGEFFCHSHDGIIPEEFIPKACGNYKSITQNV